MVKVITTASYYFPSKSGVCDWSCSCLSCSVEILKCLGLVKHPQYMSCMYITLFLVTMFIISLQVNDSFLFAELFYKNKKIISCADFPLNLPFLWITERVLLPPGLPAKEQEPHRAGWDRDERELEPPAAGKCAAGPRSSAVCWGE